MARKHTQIINPRTAVAALNEYLGDVFYMKSVMDNAYRFLTDESLDAEKVRKALAPQLKDANERMSKWTASENWEKIERLFKGKKKP